MSRSGPRTVATLATSVLVLALLLPAPARSAPAAREALALGGAVTMHAQAIERITAITSVAPVRVAGEDRFGTAVALSRRTHPDGADVVYVATAWAFADALAAAPLVTRDGAGLLLVGRDGVPPVVAAELARLAPRRVVVLGGPSAVSDGVAARIAEITGRAPERLAGVDRYATAASISRAAHPGGAERVYLATGEDWADALAAAPAVDAHDGALVLTARESLSAATMEELTRLHPSEVVVLGGPAAVPEKVLAQVESVTAVAPARLAGATRYETAQAIGEHARPDGAEVVYAATGLDWADALAAAPGIGADDGALLLVDTTVRWSPELEGAIATAAARVGTTSLAVIGTDGVLVGHRPDRPVAAASTLKVMFMAAYLRQPSVRDRDLTAADLSLLEPMITRSENDPGTVIANQLGPDPLYELAAEAGMQDFAYTRPWGNTTTSARDQARLMLHLEQLLPERHRAYAIDLLTRVVPEQRWGIGRLELPGWRVHFKGGWGAGTGSVDHQVVLLRRREGTAVALAVMTTANASHADGQATLEAVFRDLLVTLP